VTMRSGSEGTASAGGEWSAAGNVADADAAEGLLQGDRGWREVVGDGAYSTGELQGRLAQRNKTRPMPGGVLAGRSHR
jgi:hypothetical protein